MNEPIDSKPELDSGVTKVMILASVLIIFSIVLIGTFVYKFSEREVVKKLKEHDLITIAELITTKVDARIEKAIETSLTMAHDPILLEWLAGNEQDEMLAQKIFQKTVYLHEQLDYSTTFIASNFTHHYYGVNGEIIDILSEEDVDDEWYFRTISSAHEVDVNFDYNKELGDTFAFVNTLAGPIESPVAIVGVGMNLKKLSAEFAAYRENTGMNLWLIDQAGSIYLSDESEHYGMNIRELISVGAQEQIFEGIVQKVKVIEYEDSMGERIDLISNPLQSTDLTLLVEIERNETVFFLETIRWNTILAVAVSIISIVFFFFYVSRKLANPYKRTIALNKQLEFQVDIRTKELSLRNEEIMDSIQYAKRLQESVLPTDEQLKVQLEVFFVIWKPRDLVGGDFYWTKQVGNTTLIAVGDCTGHGVPGAFMTLLAVSALNRIADMAEMVDPAVMLARLNRQLKETLHQEDKQGTTDDGLDIGLCALSDNSILFAGAGISLYRTNENGLRIWKGDRKKLGYRRTPMEYVYTNHEIQAGRSQYYMTTDGFYDQNGGEKDYSFSKRRFVGLIERYHSLSMTEQKTEFLRELDEYMGNEKQRDDITVLSFRTGLSGE